MKKILKAGLADQSLDIFIQDSSSSVGAGLTGLVYNSASLVCYYRRGHTGTPTALTLATQTVGGAHSDGGFVELSSSNMPGMYRLDLSDAIVAAGVSTVTLMLKGATNMAPVTIELQLVAADLDDGVRLGLTALPNAAAGANNGLPLGDANGRVDVSEVMGNSQTAGDIVAILLAIATYTDSLESIAALRLATAQAGAAGTITLDASASSVTDFYKGAWIATLSGTGAGQTRLCTAYNGTSKVATIVPNWATNPSSDTIFAVLPNAGSDVQLWRETAPNTLQSGRVDSYVGAVADAVLTAAKFASGAFDAVWSVASRLLTAGTNIVLAKGVGVTGFNDLSAAQVNTEVDNALDTAIPGSPTANSINERIKAIDDKLPAGNIGDAVQADLLLVKAKTDNLPASPAAVGSAMTLTTGERDSVADALLDRANGVETGLTPRQQMRLAAAADAGKTSGMETASAVIRNFGDTKNRISATVDANGNRSVVTTDLT